LLRSDTTASAMSFDVIRVQEQTIMPAPPIGARESPRTKPQTNVHPAPLGCCSFNATRQKETAQRPERRLPQCAVRRGLDLGREALGLVPDFLPGVIPKEKAPAGFGGASSLQGLKTRDYPACRNPYCRSELTSNQFSVGAVAIACCFLATAREGESQYSYSIKIDFGGLTCVSYLLAQSSFRLQSEWEVAGGIIKRL
jgi:hypothetical protein